MTKKEFQSFCHHTLIQYGFRKNKSLYYLNGTKGVLCGIWLKHSQFGPFCTVVPYYFLGQFDSPEDYPSRYEYDLAESIAVMSKTTFKGSYFMSGQIEYEKYTQAELMPYFEDAICNRILPSVTNGKVSLWPRHNELHFSHKKEKSRILEMLRP